MLTFDDLAAQLGVSRAKLTALVRDGLPFTLDRRKKMFEAQRVADWLLAQGKAISAAPPQAPAPNNAAQTIATTRQEAARLLDISVRTLADWITDPSFPGKPGPPGRRDGYFPIEEIADWWARRQGLASSTHGPDESPRERLWRIKADQEQLELDIRQGKVVSVADVDRLLRRTINTTKAVLMPLADELLQDLAPDVTDATRERIRRRARQRIDDALNNIALLLAKDDDETKEPGD